MERLIRYPGALQVLDFADGKVRLVGVRALKGGLLVGHRLMELPEHLPKIDARVVAIYRSGKAITPEGETVIEEGDEVFFLAATRPWFAIAINPALPRRWLEMWLYAASSCAVAARVALPVQRRRWLRPQPRSTSERASRRPRLVDRSRRP